MRIPRIYYPHDIAPEQTLALTEDAGHHVANVLRLKVGHPVVLFNGDGYEYSGEISHVQRKKVDVEIDAQLQINPESPLKLHLGQGVSKGDRMDMVMQKAVELGVTDITPIITERCPVKLDESRWQKKHQQWFKIITGACEQSGRTTIPVLHPPVSLQNWLSESTQEHRLVLAPTATTPLSKTDYYSKGYRLLIGPEGGLSEGEIRLATEMGFNPTSLGPRILRTETAALASISLLQGLHGDL